MLQSSLYYNKSDALVNRKVNHSLNIIFILFLAFHLYSKESAYFTKFNGLAQLAIYLKTGPNWVFSLFLFVPLLKAQAVLIYLLPFSNK